MVGSNQRDTMNKTHRHLKKKVVDTMKTGIENAPTNIRKELNKKIKEVSNKFRVYPENELSKELRLNFIEWIGDDDTYKFIHDPNRPHSVGFFDMYVSPTSMLFAGPVHLNWCSKHKNSLHISTMSVLPENQRQGFGQYMMFMFLTRIHTVVGRNTDKFVLPKITLECMGSVHGKENLKMSISQQVKFFESCGFVITSVIPPHNLGRGMTHMEIDWDIAREFLDVMVARYELKNKVTNE